MQGLEPTRYLLGRAATQDLDSHEVVQRLLAWADCPGVAPLRFGRRLRAIEPLSPPARLYVPAGNALGNHGVVPRRGNWPKHVNNSDAPMMYIP